MALLSFFRPFYVLKPPPKTLVIARASMDLQGNGDVATQFENLKFKSDLTTPKQQVTKVLPLLSPCPACHSLPFRPLV